MCNSILLWTLLIVEIVMYYVDRGKNACTEQNEALVNTNQDQMCCPWVYVHFFACFLRPDRVTMTVSFN